MKNINQNKISQQGNSSVTAADGPPTIPVGVAIQRAATWRDLLSSLPNTPIAQASGSPQQLGRLIPKQLLFRAININMSDIDWLKSQHPDAASIRLYLSVPDADYPFQICGMLVPVDAQNQDMLYVTNQEGIPAADMLNDSSGSTIYDFTQPCPTVCNTSSPLFDSNNDPSPYLRAKK